MGSIVIARVPRNVIDFIGGSGGTPFDSLVVRTSGFSPRMNSLVEDIVTSVVESRNAFETPLSRGQLQQQTSAAIYGAIHRRTSRTSRTTTQNRTSRNTIRDILGRQIG